jgi:hypothetical protein
MTAEEITFSFTEAIRLSMGEPIENLSVELRQGVAFITGRVTTHDLKKVTNGAALNAAVRTKVKFKNLIEVM